MMCLFLFVCLNSLYFIRLDLGEFCLILQKHSETNAICLSWLLVLKSIFYLLQFLRVFSWEVGRDCITLC